MELKLQSGDYVPDGAGGLLRVEGREALLQRVLFRLAARRGAFPFLPERESRLWQPGGNPPAQRQSSAVEYGAEALTGEAPAVEFVELRPGAEVPQALTENSVW